MTERPVSARRPGEALLTLRLAPVNSARRRAAVEPGLSGIPGWQAVAEVLESDDPALAGRRVLLQDHLGCGLCLACRSGSPAACPLPVPLPGGALAARFVWPEAALTPLPHGVSDYDGAMSWALAAALGAHRTACRSSRLLICGAVDEAGVFAAALKNRHNELFLAGDERLCEELKPFGVRRDPGGRFELVVLCAEGGEQVTEALRRVDPGGRLLLHRCAPGPLVADLAPLVAQGCTLEAVVPGRLEEAFDRLTRRELCDALARVRRSSWPLAEAARAFAAAADPASGMVLLDNLPPTRSGSPRSSTA